MAPDERGTMAWSAAEETSMPARTPGPAARPGSIDEAGSGRTIAEPALRAHLERIADQGYTVVEDAIEPELIDALDDDLRRLEHELGARPAGNDFEGAHTVRIYNLLVHGPLYEAIPVHPMVLPVVEGVLDRGCLVSSLSSIAIDPGEKSQPIHADDQLIPIPKPHPPVVCNTTWAITDFTEANGATRLVPGSHLLDHPDYGADYPTVPAEMAKGSVLVWNGSLWHGGGANRSAARRVGIAMNYCAGYIRQQENQQLGIPRHLAREFPPRLRRLVGYSIYQGLIGHIDKRDPVTLLDDPPDADETAPAGGTGDCTGEMVWDRI
jgi:ectoine hydroxylase-related dioxygenase (phytanoyl-CoA dioxygenase family)